MRLSVALLVCAAIGMIVGGMFIGRWAVGAALMLDSVAVALFALVRDVPEPPPPTINTLPEILERARQAP